MTALGHSITATETLLTAHLSGFEELLRRFPALHVSLSELRSEHCVEIAKQESELNTVQTELKAEAWRANDLEQALRDLQVELASTRSAQADLLRAHVGLEVQCRALEVERAQAEAGRLEAISQAMREQHALRSAAEEQQQLLSSQLEELSHLYRMQVGQAAQALKQANESWDSKWNEENWGRQLSEQQCKELQKRLVKAEARLKELERDNGTLREALQTLRDSAGLANTIQKIRAVEIRGAPPPVGFDAALGNVSRVRAAVDSYIRREQIAK